MRTTRARFLARGQVSQLAVRPLFMAGCLLTSLLLSHCADGSTGDGPGVVSRGPDNAVPPTGGSGGMPGAGGMQGALGTSEGGVSVAPGSDAGAVVGPGTPDATVGNKPDAAVSSNDASAADAAQPDAQGPGPAGPTGSLPPVTDYKMPGPFTPNRVAGPSGYVLFYPKELGKDGVKHPIVSWGPGAAENAGIFSTLLNHLASHGFAVISFDATPQGQELVKGIDWMIAENGRAGSDFNQKLDTTKISAGGHSAGSLATFVIGADKRLTTTMHISGGTFDPHTDIKNLHAPALFICGEPGGDGLIFGDVASANCDIDFNNATVPVFYGITKGASHMTPTDIGDAAIRTHQLGAMVGWLRWQLAGDLNAKQLFVGSSCTLCGDAAWSTKKQKNLN